MITSPMPPTTYDQWQMLLSDDAVVPSDDLTAVLRRGRVDQRCAMAVLELVGRFCERWLNTATHRLQACLDLDCVDTDSVVLECERYSRGCARLLFFTEVDGLPEQPVKREASMIRAYVSDALASVENGVVGPECEDVSYRIARLQRRWKA